jgi:hypothetical protein
MSSGLRADTNSVDIRVDRLASNLSQKREVRREGYRDRDRDSDRNRDRDRDRDTKTHRKTAKGKVRDDQRGEAIERKRETEKKEWVFFLPPEESGRAGRCRHRSPNLQSRSQSLSHRGHVHPPEEKEKRERSELEQSSGERREEKEDLSTCPIFATSRRGRRPYLSEKR